MMLGDTAAVTLGNVASRLTGLLRVLTVAAVLGTTYLGNTYQTANLVSNLLFELLAAGLLSSVLVPPLVHLLESDRRPRAEAFAGELLGLSLASLAVVVMIAVIARSSLMGALTVAVSDPAVRRGEIGLGSFLLVAFLPQVMLYGVGAVATAVLHAEHRFAAAALAPVANNVVVVATMVLFWRLGAGHAGLDLTLGQRLVLAGGTSAGVAAMTLVPVAAARRAGWRLRPRWRLNSPEMRALGQAGKWGAAGLAFGQVLIVTTLVLANRVEGGVVAYQLAFTAFLLPYAVLAHPVLTTLYPRMAVEAGAQRWASFAGLVGGGGRALAFRVAPASALLVVVGGPVLALVRLGRLDVAGADLVGRVLGAYGLGLVGYAGLQMLTRAYYALGDTRTPALVNLGVTLAGSGLMIAGTALLPTGDLGRIVLLGVAHSVAVLGGAVAMWALLLRRLGEPWPMGAALVRAAMSATVATLVGRGVAQLVPTTGGGRLATLVGVAATGLALMATYLGGQWAMRAPEMARELLPLARRSP